MRISVATSACVVIMTAAGLSLKCIDTMANYRTSVAAQITSMTNKGSVHIHDRMSAYEFGKRNNLTNERVFQITGIDLSTPTTISSLTCQPQTPNIDYASTDLPITTSTSTIRTGSEF
jgi:hypothetical protein